MSRKAASIAFKTAGEAILLIGETSGWLGQSAYLRDVCGRAEGAPPPVDLPLERKTGDFIRALIDEGSATAVHDVSDGGLLVALAEMAMAGGIGARLYGPPVQVPAHAFWFGEDQARYVFTVAADAAEVHRARAPRGALGAAARQTGGDTIGLPSERPISSGLRDNRELVARVHDRAGGEPVDR